MTPQQDQISDQDLIAYLDGEADQARAQVIARALAEDPALAARAEAFEQPIHRLRGAMDAVLEDAPQMPNVAPRASMMPLWGGAAMAAAFALGLFVSPVLRGGPEWIDQVANYQALYVSQTLSGAVQPEATTQAVLEHARVGMGLMMDTPPRIEGMTFKRAQILGLKGAPLLQLAYLRADGTPFALCVMPVGARAQAVKGDTLYDLAVAHWVQDGLGYVLIGGADTAGVKEMAQGLDQAL